MMGGGKVSFMKVKCYFHTLVLLLFTLIIVNNSIFPIALRLIKTPLEFWSFLEQWEIFPW